MARVSVVDILERAYVVESHDDAWLADLLAATRPHFDRGLGVFALRFDVRRTDVARGAPLAFLGTPRAIVDAFSELLDHAHRRMSPTDIERVYYGAGVSSASELLAAQSGLRGYPPTEAFARRLGFADSFAFRGNDDRGVGVVIGGLTRELCVTEPAERARWTKVAAHVSAALRLRSSVRPLEDAAIFSPNGAVAHAERSAMRGLAKLREAVLGIERARRRRDRMRSEAIDMWHALVSGRWSLIDRFDRDGRRFVVAHENGFDVRGMLGLTRREAQIARLLAAGHSNKHIAYELGVADGSVAACVARLRRKVKAGSRADLVATCATMALGARRLNAALGKERLLVATGPGTHAPRAWDARLSTAERDVVDLALRGLSDGDIAARRGCARRTVSNLLASAYRKLRLSSRGELVVAAARS